MDSKVKGRDVKGVWNYVIEDVISSVAERAKCMAVLCSHASKYYDRQRTYLLVPASTISWGLNIFGMVSTYVGSGVISESLVVLIASIGNFVIATITTVAEKSKAGDKVELFNQASKDFHLIYSEISTQLSFEPKLRGPPLELFYKSDEQYKRLLQSIPNIPECVVSIFYKKFHNCDVAFPDHLAGFGLKRVMLYQPRKEIISDSITTFKNKLENELKVQTITLPTIEEKDNADTNNADTDNDDKHNDDKDNDDKDNDINEIIVDKNTSNDNNNDNNNDNKEKDNFFDSELGTLIDKKT
jgi:hypothetical protein